MHWEVLRSNNDRVNHFNHKNVHDFRIKYDQLRETQKNCGVGLVDKTDVKYF